MAGPRTGLRSPVSSSGTCFLGGVVWPAPCFVDPFAALVADHAEEAHAEAVRDVRGSGHHVGRRRVDLQRLAKQTRSRGDSRAWDRDGHWRSRPRRLVRKMTPRRRLIRELLGAYRGASAPAVYASRVILPSPMQDSLPAGWLAFIRRESNPLDRDERFPSSTFSSPSPGFILTLRCSDFARNWRVN